MPRLVLGLISGAGGGKQTFSQHLKEWADESGLTVEVFATGSGGVLGGLAKELEFTGFKVDTANLARLANAIRKHLGKNFMARAMFRGIQASNADIAVYDAIRWREDFDAVRAFGLKSHILYIQADQETRYKRIRDRRRDSESAMTFREFILREGDETAREIPVLAHQADSALSNIGSESDFRVVTRNFLERTIRPALLSQNSP